MGSITSIKRLTLTFRDGAYYVDQPGDHDGTYVLAAAYDRETAENARLRGEVARWKGRARRGVATPPPEFDALFVEERALREACEQRDVAEAQWERLLDALMAIRDHGKTHDQPCWAISQGDCAEVMQEIARVALGEAG